MTNTTPDQPISPSTRRGARFRALPRRRLAGAAVASALALAAVAGSPAGAASGPPDLDADEIAAHAFGDHDATPQGVPAGYSWRTSADTDPSRDDRSFRSYEAVNIWGQAFVTPGTSTHEVRLRVRDPRLWFLVDGEWVEADLTPGKMEGAYYEGDFQSGSTSGTARQEAPGVWSMSLSQLSGEKDTLHWWWSGMYPRTEIPDDAEGILVSQRMRLVPEDGRTSGNGARTIASTGADLFASPRTVVHPQGWNPGIPNARMSYLSGKYQTFYNTTVSLQTLERTT